MITRDNEIGNRTAEMVPALRVAPVECSHGGNNSQSQADCLKALITVCSRNGIAEETARKIIDSWTKGTREDYQQMFGDLYSFHNQKGANHT